MGLLKGLASAALLMCFVGTAAAQDNPKTYRQKDPGITVPAVIKDVKPQYPAEAKEKRIQGVVELDAVILEDGTVGEVTVTKSLDDTYGLDQAAVDALKQWLFKPGQKDGKPVPVRVAVEMSFSLK